MNWSKLSAILSIVVLFLVGIHTAMSIHEKVNGKKPAA